MDRNQNSAADSHAWNLTAIEAVVKASAGDCVFADDFVGLIWLHEAGLLSVVYGVITFSGRS
jgi:hypothetical protein